MNETVPKRIYILRTTRTVCCLKQVFICESQRERLNYTDAIRNLLQFHLGMFYSAILVKFFSVFQETHVLAIFWGKKNMKKQYLFDTDIFSYINMGCETSKPTVVAEAMSVKKDTAMSVEKTNQMSLKKNKKKLLKLSAHQALTFWRRKRKLLNGSGKCYHQT